MRTRGGFALLEMVLALFLLAIGIATTAYMIPMASRGLGQGKLVSQAVFFAQQRMEEALVSSSADVTAADPDEPLLTGRIEWSTYSANAALRRARGAVYRSDDPSRHAMVTLEALVKGP